MPSAGAAPAALPNLGRYDYASSEQAGPIGPIGDPARILDDSTIVLPLSNAPWAERPRSATAGNSTPGKNDKSAGVG
jgi:hypothetical protein